MAFEHKGLIESICSFDAKFRLWQLSDKGYKILTTRYPDVYPYGFRSENKDHDFWVTVIHLGDWLAGIPENCDLFAEQEIRRRETDDFPDWVPRTKMRRPDGYWHLVLSQPNDKSLVALEVELSKKAPESYHDIATFYSDSIFIYQVIWVVKSTTDANYILRHLMSRSSTKACEHSFILLDHFIGHQWQAKIIIGKNVGITLSETLKKRVQNDGSLATASFLLDLRKYPIKSTSPRIAYRADLGLSR